MVMCNFCLMLHQWDKYMLYLPSLPDITPNYDTGQKNVKKLSNCDGIIQNNEQELLFYCHPIF